MAKPAMPGGQTVLVKDENDIPKRKNMEYEDWSSPELTPGMKTEAVPLLKAELNGFSRELVSVQWRELDPIDLWIIKPAGVKNPPVVLYLYSSPADNARYKDTQFCQFVTRNGVAAVGFVAAVTGQRLHDRPTKDTFINQLQEALGSTSHDVQMILTYLAKRGDLDMNRVGMWGDGAGASVAIMAAAVDPRIKALDLLDPWGDWPDWLANSSLVRDSERATLLKPEMLKMVEKLDPIKYLPQLKTPLVRLQYIEEGLTATPALVQQKMEAAAPSQVNIVRYQSMKAFLDDVASKGTGFDWIKERVGSVVAGQANESHDAEKAAANLSGSSK
ncbi:MAG TPA: hypothetical protein VKV39_12855 [Candidatus Sulfotelmatobacter sp.]|nr:hypothetical protein [Candidatus Sulfotelmatobacter sp.]